MRSSQSTYCAGSWVLPLFSGAFVTVAVLVFGGAEADDHFVHFADDLRSGGVGPTMVAVPSGVVPPCEEFDPFDCSPVSTESVAVRSFAMSVREVSVREFRMFADRTGYRTWAEERPGPDGGCVDVVDQGDRDEQRWDLTWNELPWAHGEDHAVVCMTYKDAAAYARWLAKETGKSYRLPTDFEWRHVLLAGRPEPVVAPSGLSCVFRRTPNGGVRGALRPLGTCGPNPFGLYEMAGGVNEWTECGSNVWGRCPTRSGHAGCLQSFFLETTADLGVSPSRTSDAHWVEASSPETWETSTSPTTHEPEPPSRWHASDWPPWARCGSTSLDGFRVALSSSH